MKREVSETTRLKLFVPNVFVKAKKDPPAPPPVPGTVRPEDVRPPADPPLPFLVPWKQFDECDRSLVTQKDGSIISLPCDIDEDMLSKYCERHDVEGTIRQVFKDAVSNSIDADGGAVVDSRKAPEVRAANDELVQDVLASMSAPFCGSDASTIVWTHVRSIFPNPTMEMQLGGKKLKNRHKILRGPPWSIMTFADEGEIRRNMVYNGEGDAVAQIDFRHGTHIGIHAHALVRGTLDHTPGFSEDHCFHLETVPWQWVAIPNLEGTAGAEDRGLSLTKLPGPLEDVSWVPIDVPFEDYMGERAFSDEW